MTINAINSFLKATPEMHAGTTLPRDLAPGATLVFYAAC
jgi:hypothetical protein